MLINLTPQQQTALLQIIDAATIQGRFAEVVIDLKRVITTEVKQNVGDNKERQG